MKITTDLLMLWAATIAIFFLTQCTFSVTLNNELKQINATLKSQTGKP